MYVCVGFIMCVCLFGFYNVCLCVGFIMCVGFIICVCVWVL